jgi:hypothetical protein
MSDKRKGRNPMTGKFEKGNTYAGASKATGIPHPDYPHLDTTGHPLPGFSLNPISAQHAKGLTVPQSVHQLRLELIKCAKPADIKAVSTSTPYCRLSLRDRTRAFAARKTTIMCAMKNWE